MPATDQLMKEVLQQFLQGFLQLFFPQIAQRLDFDRGIRFRDKELFTDFPEGERREADLVAEVHGRDGQPELVLFHVEAQAKRRRDFPYRMWEYYALLRLRTGLPIFPAVVYLSPGTGGLIWEEYTESLFEERLLTFRYAAVGLPDLGSEEYAGSNEALAAALSTAMAPHPLGNVQHKLAALHAVAGSGLDDARKLLLAAFIETFLPLSDPAEAEEFSQRIASDQSAQDVLNHVAALNTTQEMEALSERLLIAQTLEELGLVWIRGDGQAPRRWS